MWRAVFLILALSAASLGVRVPSPAAAQDAGNSYVSENYGFRATWDDRIWFVIDQGPEDGWDEIVLSDGIAYVFITAGFGYDGQVQPCVDDAAESMARTPGIDDVTPLAGDDGEPIRGEDDARAFSTYIYSYTYADGETVEFVRYVECRPLIPGESVVVADVVVPAPLYAEEMPLAQELLANLTLPSPGEPAPVFLSEHWRLAVVGAERGSRIRAAGLSPKSDKDWLVIVVDVTNWITSDDELSVRDFGLRLGGTDNLVLLAPASTVAAAKELGTGPASANRGVSFPAGRTRRLTLAFQIPRVATAPALVRAGSALPLDDVLAAGADLSDLPPPLGPPFLREARVDGLIGDDLVKITFLGDGDQAILHLIGAGAPRQNDCYGEQVAAEFAGIVGKTVRIEREPGTPVAPSISGYLWTETADGIPVLFNQQLVAGGYAEVTAAETDTRFGAWLVESEQTAQSAGLGLWGECFDPRDRPLATPEAA